MFLLPYAPRTPYQDINTMQDAFPKNKDLPLYQTVTKHRKSFISHLLEPRRFKNKMLNKNTSVRASRQYDALKKVFLTNGIVLLKNRNAPKKTNRRIRLKNKVQHASPPRHPFPFTRRALRFFSFI